MTHASRTTHTPAEPRPAQPWSVVGRPTTVVSAPRLSERLGVDLTLVSEAFQRTGSFKFRAAYHVAATVPHPVIITASSGNFGQAMAYACSLVGKHCTVVMPHTSAQVKIDAVREYGGEVDLIDTAVISRSERVRELASREPEAYIASAYDDPLVIEGNATLGAELAALGQMEESRGGRRFDCIVAPIGGGGLTSGIITGLAGAGDPTPVIGAEPLLANDAARSLRAGRIVRDEQEAATVADGARTLSIGEHNWAILREHMRRIVEVPEQRITEAVRLLFLLANLKAEPTGALSLGALLTEPELFRDRSVCCIISGGNVDAEVYRRILAEAGSGLEW